MSRFLANPTVFPTKLPGLQFWLDAQDTGSFVWNNTALSQWNDKSGCNYHCTQAVGSNQPNWTGSNIAFGGVSNSYMNMPQAAINNAATYSMFFVVNPISQSNWFMAKQYNGVGTYNALSMTRYVVSGGSPGDGILQYMYWHPQNSVDITNSSNVISTNTLQLFALHYNGSTLTMTRNGTTLSATASTNSAIANQTGATNFLLGAWISDIAGNSFNNPGVTNFQLSELLFYNGTLDTSQIQQLEGYLTWKWSLQTNLPVNHPFGSMNPGRLPVSQTPPLTQFKPTNLSNCLLWMDAADSATLSLTSSNTVAAWYDKSGNGNAVLQAVGTQQPVWTSNVLKGLPGLLFSGGGTNQRLVTASSVAALNGIPGLTLFAVLRPTWTSGQGGINNPCFFGMRQTGTKINYYFMNNYSATSMFNGTVVVNHSGSNATSSIAQNRNLLYCSTNNNGTDLAYYNGSLTSDSQAISFGAGTSLPIIVGGDNVNTEDWVGYIFEIIFYPYVLTNSDRQLVEAYLATKWGMTLPVNHSLQGRTSYSLVLSPNPSDAYKPYSVNYTPLFVPGCTMWLDTSDFNAMVLQSGKVSILYDKSGNNNHMIQTNAAYQPPYSFDPVYNRFGANFTNGVGTFLAPFTITNYPLTTGQFTFIIVCRFSESTVSGVRTICRQANGSTSGFQWIRNQNNALSFYILGGEVQSALTTAQASGVFAGVGGIGNSVFIAGTSVGTGTRSSTIDYSLNFNIGGNGTGEGFTGYIYEFLVYNTALTTTQRQSIESYLSQKWGLASSLPTNHVNFTSPAGLPPGLPLTRKQVGFRVRMGPITISSFIASGLTVSLSWLAQSSASYQLTLFSNTTNLTTGGTQVSQLTTTGTTTTYSGLIVNTFYYVSLRPIDIDGITLGPSTLPSSAIGTTPAAPTSPSVAIVGSTANCSWTASRTASTYTVQFYAAGVLSQTTTGVIGTTTSFTGLVSNRNYYIIVTALNSAGTSAGAQSTTVLTVPSALSVAPTLSYSGSTANVSWSAPTGGAASYTIQLYAAGVLSQTNTGVTGTSTSFSAIAGNTNHYVAVSAVNASGSSAATNSITVLSVPAIPTSPTLSITTPAPGTATVSWTAPAGGVASYTVQFYQSGGLRTTNTGVATTSTTFTVVTGNATYFAIVFGVNATGNSTGAQTANNDYLLLPDAITSGGITIYPYSSTSVTGASIYNTPANRATAYFVRLYSSNVTFTTGGTVAANLTGAQWSGGGAAFGPLTANLWYRAEIWSSNANGSNGPYQTATVQATALTFTTAFRVFNNNAFMNFIFGTASASGILQLWGAAGHSGGIGGSGNGAYVRGTFSYATATHYRATIGAGGETGKATWVDYNGNGGGSFYSGLHAGGRTAWQRWSGSAWVDIAIAGGGGGANGDGNTGTRYVGGHAAGSGIGFTGNNIAQQTAFVDTGQEGTQGGGGGTTGGGQSANSSYNGTLGVGGTTSTPNSGGGGGGYYGGGGATGSVNTGGGGGGGSSLSSGLTTVTTLNGNGSITTQTNYLAFAAVSGNDGLLVIDM